MRARGGSSSQGGQRLHLQGRVHWQLRLLDTEVSAPSLGWWWRAQGDMQKTGVDKTNGEQGAFLLQNSPEARGRGSDSWPAEGQIPVGRVIPGCCPDLD